MSSRDAESLTNLDLAESGADKATTLSATPEPSATIELNYPEPTLLSIVVKDVARWAKLSFVMEPTVNVKIQIFSPRKLTVTEAYEVFLASLSVVGLRAVRVGLIVKIVPSQLGVSA